MQNLLIIVSVIIECFSTGNNFQQKKNIFEKYLTEDSKVFIYNDRHSTEYILLNTNSTFYYEIHQDVKFSFSTGRYDNKNGKIIFHLDKKASYDSIKEYCGSMSNCNYNLALDFFDGSIYQISNNQIISKKNKVIKEYAISEHYQIKLK